MDRAANFLTTTYDAIARICCLDPDVRCSCHASTLPPQGGRATVSRLARIFSMRILS